jgi:hypothetical protein
VLYYRTESDFQDLLDPEWNVKSSVYFEDTKAQMFLQIRKLDDN